MTQFRFLRLLPLCLLMLMQFCLHAQGEPKVSPNVLQYIEQYRALAIEEMQLRGIPASVTLAQGIYESAAGSSRLAREANNHFGIKCKTEWTGATIRHTDDLRNECFRKYTSAEASYRDHSEFLRTRAHYAFLFQLAPTDYKGWVYGLKRAGYATSPRYPAALLRLIETYRLDQYDAAAVGSEPTSTNTLNRLP